MRGGAWACRGLRRRHRLETGRRGATSKAHKLATLSETNRTSRRVAVTGGSGYLGSRVAARLLADGWEVISLARRPSGLPGVRNERFELGSPLDPTLFAGIDALVHCAWDFGQRTQAGIEAVNVQGTRALLELAASSGVERTVHVSTLSASGSPRSMYGRAKLMTEEIAREHGAAVVRPGLVYGPGAGGMVGMLATLVRLLPAVPVLVGADHPLYLAHQDDLVTLVAFLAGGPAGEDERPIVAAGPDGHSLRDVLAAIAAAEGRRRVFFRIPWQPIYVVLRGMELVRLPPPMRSDSALSIATLDPDPFGSGAPPEPVTFRTFEPSALVDVPRAAAVT